MHPTDPGSPVEFQDISIGKEIHQRTIRTADDEGQQSKPLKPAHEPVEDDARPAADHHGTKEWRPALCEEGSNMFVANGVDEAGSREADDDGTDEERDGGVDYGDKDGGGDADEA